MEIPVMVVMYMAWIIFYRRTEPVTGDLSRVPLLQNPEIETSKWLDMVDVKSVNLYVDEHIEGDEDKLDDDKQAARLRGGTEWLWQLYHWVV